MPAISSCSPLCLPQENELVSFLVDDREAPVIGRFAKGKFHSRWAAYDIYRIQSWQQAPESLGFEPAIPIV